MLLDAYTIRKAIPRIVVAVIGINLSIYLCIALIDATNVVGGGMAQLLTAPFNTAELDEFSIDSNFASSNTIIAGVGIAVGGPSILALLGVFFKSLGLAGGVAAGAGVSTATAGLAALFFIIILPVLLLILGILAVVIIRQALLLFLTIVSPVAIALWVLPGTEKYFKKWFDLFTKALLVYPIIAVIFAMSDIFGSIIFSNTDDGALSIPRIITGLAVIYAPLFLIPFAFRFAGGAIAGLAKAVGGLGDRVGQSGLIKGRQEYYGQNFKDTQTRARAEAFRAAKRRQESHVGNGAGAKLGRTFARRQQRALAGYREDLYQREAEMTKRLDEEQELQKNFGDDTDRRAYGIDVKAAREDMKRPGFSEVKSTDSKGRTVTVRTSANGKMKQTYVDDKLTKEEFRSLGGSWQSEAAVEHAEKRFGRNNLGQLQQTLSYEMTKAIEEGQQEGLVQRYGELSQAWGMSSSEKQGTWIGPAFKNQQEDLMFKHTKFNEDGTSYVDHGAMTREVYEKKGPQMLAYLKGKNVLTLREAHKSATERLNTYAVGTTEHEQAKTELAMHESIADTLSAKGGAAVTPGGAPGAPGAPDPAAGPTITPTGGSSGSEYGYTTGSGHTTDELKAYFAEVQATARERSGVPSGRVNVPDRPNPTTPPATDTRAAERNADNNPDRF